MRPTAPNGRTPQSPEGVRDILGQLGKRLGTFCPGAAPDIRFLLDALDRLMSAGIDSKAFCTVACACRDYVAATGLEVPGQDRPVEEAHQLLESLFHHLERGEAFMYDYSDVLAHLKVPDRDRPQAAPAAKAKPAPISAEDLEILTDFIDEAEAGLDAIEVSLMALESDPTDTEIINDIFRPFHTIKGVAGFLGLTRINTLAHATENLLDAARDGSIAIDRAATDAILESVDTLKALVGRLKAGIVSGLRLPDDDIGTEALQQRLSKLQKGEGRRPIGEILIRAGAVDQAGVERALERQRAEPGRKLGKILVDEQIVTAGQVAAALKTQNLERSPKQPDPQVKVSTRKLDDLVDYAGELVIAQSMLRQQVRKDPALAQSVTHLGQIVTNMQTLAMSMRMIPIKATFMKMIRLVRDLGQKSGKDVDLVMSGQETEIDRNVVDALYDPMVHMIRNAVDHGLEPKSERLEKGKPARGTISLTAYHKGGHIMIEIEDDGRGLDRERILEKALKTGLVTQAESLPDARVFEFILMPGFSTAKRVTDLSGRGVGMDVVKESIEKLRGHLTIDSRKDAGTRFTISLPLTMAIIDGMLVRADRERYVIPTVSIQKVFKPALADYFTVEGKGELVRDRDRLIPLIRLSEVYGTGASDRPVTEGLVVVVESKEGRRGLLIDELLGKDEYVIKSLGSDMEDVQGLAGGAILADGQVGLILDIHGVISMASAA